MKFKISEKEGLKYSNISGDKNKIHIDYLTGYNSIYGEKICHGTLVVSKIFKNKEFKKLILSEKPFNIRIEFLEFIKYDEIFVLKKINNKFHIIQNNKVKIHISIQKRNNYYFNKKNKKKVRYFKKKLISFKNKYDLIFSLLANISSFVGNKYPGKYSLLRSINLNFNNNYLLNEKKIIINSYKLDKRFPLIENVLQYEKFIIEFESLERPIVQKNKFYIKNDLKQKIKTLKDNVLIIGGSSGIGNDIFNLFKVNKDILKIVTFNKNKISLKIANSLFFKIDILRDLNKIKFIINKYGPVQIFYFPTTKISFDKKVNNEKLKEYKKIFLNIPLKIIKNSKKKIISVFYPSTTYIYDDKFADYSKVKQLAEVSLKKLCKRNKIIYKSVRFPALNSKQSISLLNPTPPSFYEYLNRNPKLVDKIF
tara:strand:+ start:274 stop:1542 length:1269 start_codon:yes stop_codon:yes gene_type:complete